MYVHVCEPVFFIQHDSGWTPSSFVSSRGKKAEYSQQKPEDFMDHEVSSYTFYQARDASLEDFR